MGRKPKRVRDPNRSHGRASAAVPAVQRELAHGSVVLQGHGWRCGKLSAPALEELRRCLSCTKLSGSAYHDFSGYGEQGNDKPLKQRRLLGSPLWRACWKGAAQATLRDMNEIMCPKCGESVTAHEIVSCDMNVMWPGAAVWPHMDVFDNVGHGPFVGVTVLLQPAAKGGLFRVARELGEGGVAWREVGKSKRLARVARDTVLVPLFVSGDVIVFSGDVLAHEVQKVSGETPRVSMVMALRCRSS